MNSCGDRKPFPMFPPRLSGLGISVASDVQSFGHQDEAMAVLTGSMTPEALEALSPGKSLPIACAFEDKAATVEMGQVQNHVRYQGNTFTVDMADALVVSSKRIITPWYNTDTKEELSADAVSSQAGSFAWGQRIDRGGSEQFSGPGHGLEHRGVRHLPHGRGN